MIFLAILLLSMVAVVGVAMYVSRQHDHGEARFDTETGQVKPDEPDKPTGPIEPASRKLNGKMIEDE